MSEYSVINYKITTSSSDEGVLKRNQAEFEKYHHDMAAKLLNGWRLIHHQIYTTGDGHAWMYAFLIKDDK